MEIKYSDRANALAVRKERDFVCEEAEAFVDDETLDELAVGFDLAMELVRMSALSKHAGADLRVWAVTAEGHNVTAYFVTSGEDELLSRLEPLPDA
jgi:hypothetical protein